MEPLGSSYPPAGLDTALEDRTLLELRAMIRPSEDLALYRADMAEWPGHGELRDWRSRIWLAGSNWTSRCRVDWVTPAPRVVAFRWSAGQMDAASARACLGGGAGSAPTPIL